jgi:hypothetical protein
VHLSGCPRSCAVAHVAPATLLACAPGRYDLYLRDARQPGFGALRATNLTLKKQAPCSTCRRSTLMIDYIRDGQEIYRNSFAIIRARPSSSASPPTWKSSPCA